MTTVTIDRTGPATATAETINRTYKTTETAEIINRTGPAWETDEEITPKDPKSYLGLIHGRDWQTHLPPSPEGQLLASADFCRSPATSPTSSSTPRAGRSSSPASTPAYNRTSELCYFLKQENGLMPPVTKAESGKP